MFGKRLRDERRRLGLTQADLAARLGISSSAVGMYEQGRREPDAAMLTKISRLFDVTSDYLLGVQEASARTDGAQEIEDVIEEMRGKLLRADGLMFNGVPLQQEDIEKLIDAMRLSAGIVLGKPPRF